MEFKIGKHFSFEFLYQSEWSIDLRNEIRDWMIKQLEENNLNKYSKYIKLAFLQKDPHQIIDSLTSYLLIEKVDEKILDQIITLLVDKFAKRIKQ
jgi:DNA-binding SARP family transcriptional activator